MQPLHNILPQEGCHVVHIYYQVEHSQWDVLDRREKIAAKTSLAELVREIRSTPDTQLLLFSVVTPKADCGFMLLTPDLQVADDFCKRLGLALGPGILTPVFSWLSMTEKSEYAMSEEEYSDSLGKVEGIVAGSPEHSEKLESFRARISKYLKDRLTPKLPDWPVICFYPMSRRRTPEQNWYALDFEARKALMGKHSRVGRTYSGKVLQLVTGSTGLDDGEWGVTLFSNTTSEIKSIVYEMRFEETSAVYTEFGEFFIGIQMPLDALFDRLLL